MTAKNRYAIRAKISEAKFRQLVRHFAHDLDAQTIASLIQLNRNTVNRYLTLIRKRIAAFCEQQCPFEGETEVDESYFDGKCIKGKRGPGAYKKTAVFGILKRGGKVYTEIVPDCAKVTLQGIIRGRVSPDSIIHSDGWRGYSGLVDLGYKKYYRVNHGSDEFVNRKRYFNGIESFWSYAKRRLEKFHGIADSTFYLHLKECEFRFNYRDKNLYQMLLKMFRENPLF
jgi:transposase-like protein